ncbi:MAG TPA: hypothetical protein VJI52_05300 [Candidatus Nanoarchaeia archaeon]|nr:hypothetical protein [Candidatus Nanoarchaeia archaeon]
MNKSSEIHRLLKEDSNRRESCNLCKDAAYKVGEKTGYGAVIFKVGNKKNGWFATLSPQTGGNPEFDFTVQIMPLMHLTHFSQIEAYPRLAENYGVIFSKISGAMAQVMISNENLSAEADDKSNSVPIAAYGKCTTWKEKKEHLHIKIFPFRGNIGQPYTVDSSFEKKEVLTEKDGKEFVKMSPVKKVVIDSGRFEKLAKRLELLLKK